MAREQKIVVPENAQRLLSAYTPLLEGLALYAQLDFEAEAPGYAVPSPLTIAQELFPVENFGHFALRDVFRMVRDFARAGKMPYTNGLLSALLLDNRRADRNYYFTGYLYVKAAEALFIKRCARYAEPSLFLPAIIKITCDHGVVEHALENVLSVEEIITEIHNRIVSFSSGDLTRIAAMFRHDKARKKFDNWDAEAQYQSGQFDNPIYSEDKTVWRFFNLEQGSSELDWAARFRAAASVQVLGWKEGQILKIEAGALMLRSGTEEISVVTARLSNLWPSLRSSWLKAHPDAKDEEDWNAACETSLAFEEQFFQELHAHIGRNVTIGTFVTQTAGVFGAAIWVDGRLKVIYPGSPEPFLKGHLEAALIVQGLEISPADRVDFAKSFADEWKIVWGYRPAEDALLKTLVSREGDRDKLTKRFASIFSKMALHLRAWCNYRSDRQEQEPLPEDLVAAGNQVFNFPGFGDGNGLSFRDLFPLFKPPSS